MASGGDSYILRPRIYVKIFANSKPKLNKSDKQDEQDFDGEAVDNFFTTVYPVDKDITKNRLVDDVTGWFKKELPKIAESYDCFFFVFLSEDKAGRGLTLKFYDGSLDLETLFDTTKTMEYLVGKPKIFLVKADNESLHTKVMTKGADDKRGPRKIPQDSDRLIIVSTLPQSIELQCRPCSFLVDAFCSAMEDEAYKNEDFLTLTTRINKRVSEYIQEFENEVGTDSNQARKSELPVPHVTSTLRKLLYFPKTVDDFSRLYLTV